MEEAIVAFAALRANADPASTLQFVQSIHQHGYAVIKLPEELSKGLEQLEQQTASFYATVSSEHKRALCCESTASNSTRDRLELRFDAVTQTLVPCLNRGQYYDGFAVSAAGQEKDATSGVSHSSATELLHRYFTSADFLVGTFRQIESVAYTCASVLCSSFGLKVDELFEKMDSDAEGHGHFHSSILRLLKYPQGSKSSIVSRTSPDFEVCAGDHTDIGLVTVMPCSKIAALQVLGRDFAWKDVEISKNRSLALIVAGEQLAYLSNYKLSALRHRVIRPEGNDRISFPFLTRLSPNCKLVQTSTGLTKLASQIANRVFSMNDQVQRRLKEAVSVVKNLEEHSTTASFQSKGVQILGALAVTPTPTPGQDEPQLVLTYWKSVPSRGHFLTLMKSLAATQGKYTAYAPWESQPFKTQVATFTVHGIPMMVLMLTGSADVLRASEAHGNLLQTQPFVPLLAESFVFSLSSK